MRRSRTEANPVPSVTSWLPEVDPAFRDEVDPDPLVEEMVARLRGSLAGLVALDEYGRPVPWRSVVRLALGSTLGQLRDAETSVVLAQHLSEHDCGAAVTGTVEPRSPAGRGRDSPAR